MKRALMLTILVAGCTKPGDAPKPSGPPQGARRPKVSVAAAEQRELEYAIEAAGSIEAAEEISIPARVGGVLDAVNFKEGDTVDEKTVLAEIEVERFRINVSRAQADHDRAKAQAQLAETLLANRVKLQEEGAKQGKNWVTEEELATRRADVEKAKADVGRTQADLALATRDHTHSRVHPPLAGVINGKLVSKGEFVKAETIIATMLNVSTLHVRFTLPELETSRLATGQEIRFSIRSIPNRDFAARLFYLSQKADATTRSVECKAEILEKHEHLRTNLFASVRIVTGKQKGVMVPERAVLSTERGFIVFVLDGAKAKSRVVKLGLRSPDGVEVTEGIQSGDTVVTDGAAGLRDGADVDIVGSGK